MNCASGHVGASRVVEDRLRRTGDRYDMARTIAERVREANGDVTPDVALVANGANPPNFVDALALSAISSEDDLTPALNNLQQTCAACHALYRDR